MLSDDDMLRIIRESYPWSGGELNAGDRQLIRAIERALIAKRGEK